MGKFNVPVLLALNNGDIVLETNDEVFSGNGCKIKCKGDEYNVIDDPFKFLKIYDLNDSLSTFDETVFPGLLDKSKKSTCGSFLVSL